MWENKIAKMGRNRVKIQDVIDGHNEEGYQLSLHSGKRYVGPPPGYDGNGYQTHQCLNPGMAIPAQGGAGFYPKRKAPLQFWKNGKVRIQYD